jgi:hypothetical protein
MDDGITSRYIPQRWKLNLPHHISMTWAAAHAIMGSFWNLQILWPIHQNTAILIIVQNVNDCGEDFTYYSILINARFIIRMSHIVGTLSVCLNVDTSHPYTFSSTQWTVSQENALVLSQDNAIGIMARLWTGQTGSGAYPASYWINTVGSYLSEKAASVWSWTPLSNTVMKSTQSYASTPVYVFVAWSFIKYRDRYTFLPLYIY